jgi:hypothetical protein
MSALGTARVAYQAAKEAAAESRAACEQAAININSDDAATRESAIADVEADIQAQSTLANAARVLDWHRARNRRIHRQRLSR